MSTTRTEHDVHAAALAADLASTVRRRVLDPLEILLAPSAADARRLDARLNEAVDDWVASLLGDNTAEAVATASRLLAALFGDVDEQSMPRAWWPTPFGRVVAHRMGYPGRTELTRAEAAALLGITRQGVHDLVGRGKLDRTTAGGVTNESVRARLGGLS